MWILPMLLLGAIVIAAASRSPRERVPASRQLPPSVPPPAVAGLPGPISVLGEILRIGQAPSPTVILCALAEAQSIGRNDLASDIVRVFVAPVVHAHQRAGARSARPDYERGSCAKPGSPRAEADQRGSCARPGSPREVQPAAVSMPAASVPQMASRPATEDEILAMLHVNPQTFLQMVSSGRPPMVEVPIGAPPPPPTTQAAAAPVPVLAPSPRAPDPAPAVVDEAAMTDAVSAQLRQLAGFAGAGVTLVDPSTGAEVFEVSWLRGHPLPPLPQQISHWPVRVVIIDNLPVPQPTAPPPEAVTEAPIQARPRAPGSPLGGVSDDAWRMFVARLERESPTFHSTRHVGQYRQRRERLAELGVNPSAIHGSAAAQRTALDADLAEAHGHATEGGLLEHLGRAIAVPGHDGSATITLSGVLGVIQCAGLEGAVGWLEKPNDRKRYPHTTQAFLRTNGVF